MGRNSDDNQLPRRQYLALSGVLVTSALAGCSDEGDSEEDDDDGDSGDSTEPDSSSETNNQDNNEEGTDGDQNQDQDQNDEDDNDEEDEPDPAEFEVVEIDHPDEVEVGEEHTLSVTVENIGGQTGNFQQLLEISTSAEPGWEEVGQYGIGDVDPGATATESTDPFAFDEPATYQFRLGGDGGIEWEYDVIAVLDEIDPMSFSGTGQEVRQGISIDGGLTVVDARHDGERNFQVSLEDDREFGNLFVNQIGTFDGVQANLVDQGEYILDVTADGSWSVTIRQPRATEGEQLPVSISGEGPRVYGPVEFSGTGIATGDHNGESNFQVEILPMQGTFGELVFNEIGDFSGETAFSFDGLGWVDINADGNWSLEIE